MLTYEIVSVCFIVFCLWLAREARVACERIRAENERSDIWDEYFPATAAKATEGSMSFKWPVSKVNE